jgi:hypothetical protein
VIARLWAWHRRTIVISAALISALALTAGVVLAVSSGHAQHSPASGDRTLRPPATSPPGHRAASPGQGQYHPRYVTVPQTARQTQLASALAAAESSQEIAAGEALQVPAGRYSTEYPAVPMADTTDELSYARAWVTELLDTNYGSQPRDQLLAWAVEGQAGNTLPGVPESVQDKALYASLAVPNLGGVGGATPVPSAAIWSADATRGIVQHVSGVEVSVDTHWTSLVGEGFVPVDPLLAFIDVSGTMTTEEARASAATAANRRGKAETAQRVADLKITVRFKLVLTVGSALHHPGYGAVSVEDWTVI